MGSFVMPLLTLILTQKLGISKASAGSLISLLLLTEAPCLILGGKLADSVGRKKTIVVCSLAGAFFYMLCAFLPHRMVLFIMIASDFYVMASPSFSATLADLTCPENRQSAFSLMYFGMNIGAAVSPIIGGLLFQNHLPLLFFLDAATTVGYTAVIAKNVPETFRRAEKPGLSAEKAPEKKQTIASVLRGLPVLVAFVALLFLYDFCYSQWNFMLPAQCGDLFGPNGARRFSLLASANGFTVILLTPAATALSRRFRPLAVVAVGGFFYFCAYLGFAFGNSFFSFFIFIELFTVGEIVTTIQIEAFVTGRTPSAFRGRISAFENFVRGAAQALGPLAMGYLLTDWGYRASWSLIAGIVLAGGLGMLLLNRRDRRSSEKRQSSAA